MADQPIPDKASPAPSANRQIRRDPISTTLATGISLLATLLGLIALLWLLLFVTKGRFLKPAFESLASRMTERQVRVAGDFQFYFNIIDLKFLADGLTVSNPKWASRPNFFEARHIDTRIETIPLIFGKRRAEWLILDGGKVDAEWDAQRRNTWTFGDPNRKGAPFQWPVIRRATVSGTEVRYRDPQLQLLTDVKLDMIRAGGTRIVNDQVRLTGNGTLRGKPFVMSGGILTPNSTVRFGRTSLILHAQSGPTRLDVNGSLPAATQIEGSDLTLMVRGPNLRLLFDFLGVAVPDTRSYRFTSRLTKADDEWRFTRLNGFFGDSDLAGRMTISMPNERLFIDADLASRKVDIIDVGPFVGYAPNALATKGPTAAVSQTGGAIRLLPDAPLRIDAISRFDAHVDYQVRTIRAPNLPVSNVALVLDLEDRLLKLSPLTMDVAGGHLASDISINARVPAVITEYDIRLSPTPMGRLLRGIGAEESGTTGTLSARVQMRGTGDTLRDSLATSNGRIAMILPQGSFWTRNIQLSEIDIGTFIQKMFEQKLTEPVQINCGLIAFTVRQGLASADPILIDTRQNVMIGRGGFSFRDESLNLAFRADAKKFSLFSGQSPVGLGGHFAAPRIDVISPELMARGGAGLGLAAVNPLAAILAFVDPGDAKAAACGPILSGARASAQRTTKGEPRKDVGAETKQEPQKKKKFLGIF
ncbi:AsmA family protein [Sphingomonas oleivorans]|uniref:AsmA family protein n=1 Tax=Sphingomonas oleivorans TaxID=1735121 RepID=A0A2T5G372_9SPHN|nr:AsmA family protein [Sphingomonas oleivorans]PTQ13602.1 AsmA family protein [Sphingomonas oleivorans]